MVWVVCAPIVFLYLVMNQTLIQVFMESPSEMAILSGSYFLKIVSPFYFLIAVKLITDGILRGTGSMKQFMIATFTDLILRVILVMILSKPFGYVGIWASWPLGLFLEKANAEF